MSLQNFKKLKTLQDIKLEKTKIRFEMILAENKLMDSLNAVEQVVTIASFFRRFVTGFRYAQSFLQNFYKYIDRFMFWKKDKEEDEDESTENKKKKEE